MSHLQELEGLGVVFTFIVSEDEIVIYATLVVSDEENEE